mmetsp:Transcript_1691/g.2427  ORF Transcript_1691/g.2427 Transcript_1691/m.2427 type:complete len:277 (-) Transcript_1691:54-884(-)
MKKIISIISVLVLGSSMILPTTTAQFGVTNKKKGSFEELQDLAQEQLGNENLIDNLANFDEAELQNMIQNAMNDPQLMKTMEDMKGGIGDVMEQLASMDPDQLREQMMEGLQQLTSPDIVDSVMGNKDEVLASLKEQGLVTDEQMAEYQANPGKFEEEMASAFQEMQKIFENPETLEAATKMMEGMAKMAKDPKAALREIAENFSSALDSDDKIEEARLQLLTNPDKAGDPALSSLFQNDEMKEILKDPVKWREQVKKGQEMLLGDENLGAGIGEL